LRPDRRTLAAGGTAFRVLRLAALGAFLFALPGCRLDMHVQPKYKPLAPTDFFGDGRAARPVVTGTVARGQLRLDEHLYTGKVDGLLVTTFPFAITRADLERGQERFTIYCTPCHDATGHGRGMIVLRGFPPPPSYHIQRLREAPVGHFFDVITNGLGNMYGYAARITPEDRWRIIAYIRALQLSQAATLNALSAAERTELEEQKK